MGWGTGIDIQKHLSKLGELHMRTPTLKKKIGISFKFK